MTAQKEDFFTDAPSSSDTLANLGPLTGLAGTWYGDKGVDTHPEAHGAFSEPFVETVTCEPLDAQNNGPQVLYGLRYHVAITRPGSVSAFHEQVGYWLWEPATGTVTLTVAIPRAQVLMAVGHADAHAKSFTVKAVRESLTNGIISGPFLERAFKTTGFEQTVTFNDDGTWSYDEVTKLVMPGVPGEFEHRDVNTLRLIAYPRANPRGIDEKRFLR